MTKDLMTQLGKLELRTTPKFLQLMASSVIKPNGMVEDIIVTLYSWEYPTNCIILSPKASLGGIQ